MFQRIAHQHQLDIGRFRRGAKAQIASWFHHGLVAKSPQ